MCYISILFIYTVHIYLETLAWFPYVSLTFQKVLTMYIPVLIRVETLKMLSDSIQMF